MSLQVSTGYCSLAGSREENQDFCGIANAPGGGPEAAEYSVRGLLADYYATPDTWAIPHALDRVLNANNRWLISQASTHRQLDSMATTLTALVLRGRRYTVAHVG